MTQEFVTLPREVAERALKSMLDARCSVYDGFEYDKAATALAAAMQQTPAPDHPQNHVPDAGNMVTAGWKLVPVEPTRDMLTTWIKAPVVSNTTAPDLYRSMLNTAPKPPTVKHSLTVEQPQVEQEPVAKVVLTEQLGLPCLQWLDLDRQFDFKGGELLYTHPQPKRDPLTDEEINKINRSTTWPVKSLASLGDRQWAELLRCAARAIEAAHNIK